MNDMLPTTAPDIRATRAVTDGVGLLLTYYAQPGDEPLAVTEFLYLAWLGTEWYPDGNAQEARPAGEPLPPVQFLSGGYVTQGDLIAFAGGVVADALVHEVSVTFNDGSQQVVRVERGAYLAVQLGVEGVRRVEALDDQGQTLHRH